MTIKNTIFRHLLVIALGLSSLGTLSAAEAKQDPAQAQLALMERAAVSLEQAGKDQEAATLWRSVKARRLRLGGSLGNLSVADYDLLKQAPTVEAELKALRAALVSFREADNSEDSAALKRWLDERTEKAAGRAASLQARQKASQHQERLKRLEAKVERLRRMLNEVESELAQLRGQ